MSTYPAKYIHISVRAPFETVYDFVSNPLNLPKWAAGLADATLRREGAEWITSSPMGEVRITFVDKNPYGVVDHYVVIPNGSVIYTPLKVIKTLG
jgi:uncharacterized protein YndB with AHSA1/START domain